MLLPRWGWIVIGGQTLVIMFLLGFIVGRSGGASGSLLGTVAIPAADVTSVIQGGQAYATTGPLSFNGLSVSFVDHEGRKVIVAGSFAIVSSNFPKKN
jgi:hypothetical protein